MDKFLNTKFIFPEIFVLFFEIITIDKTNLIRDILPNFKKIFRIIIFFLQ